MLISFLRAIFLYLVLIGCIRLMGKRQIGQMGPAEFVITMLLANIAAVPMQNNSIPLVTGLMPILTVLGMELVLSVLTMRSVKLRKLLSGKPVILIENGRLLEENVRMTRVNLDELTELLREKGIFDLSTIKYAILETNGQISTLLFAKDQPAVAKDAGVQATEQELPFTLISNGRLMHENLTLCKLDKPWLDRELRKRGVSRKQVLLMTVDKQGTIYFAKKEGKG